jgi:hypothetical protein
MSILHPAIDDNGATSTTIIPGVIEAGMPAAHVRSRSAMSRVRGLGLIAVAAAVVGIYVGIPVMLAVRAVASTPIGMVLAALGAVILAVVVILNVLDASVTPVRRIGAR